MLVPADLEGANSRYHQRKPNETLTAANPARVHTTHGVQAWSARPRYHMEIARKLRDPSQIGLGGTDKTVRGLGPSRVWRSLWSQGNLWVICWSHHNRCKLRKTARR
mmetsp:Transcript_30237/g.83428  ORF Transcript_30237/g.83428 Transcript_30237/m.83428 type:complete len:107 (+) Transcript_30237:293-613(+)